MQHMNTSVVHGGFTTRRLQLLDGPAILVQKIFHLSLKSATRPFAAALFSTNPSRVLDMPSPAFESAAVSDSGSNSLSEHASLEAPEFFQHQCIVIAVCALFFCLGLGVVDIPSTNVCGIDMQQQRASAVLHLPLCDRAAVKKFLVACCTCATGTSSSFWAYSSFQAPLIVQCPSIRAGFAFPRSVPTTGSAQDLLRSQFHHLYLDFGVGCPCADAMSA